MTNFQTLTDADHGGLILPDAPLSNAARLESERNARRITEADKQQAEKRRRMWRDAEGGA